jgi:hypothetical protein
MQPVGLTVLGDRGYLCSISQPNQDSFHSELVLW